MTKPRGTALIINNMTIPNEEERLGSEIDVENLTNMLQLFQFNVKSETDLTAKVTGQHLFFILKHVSLTKVLHSYSLDYMQDSYLKTHSCIWCSLQPALCTENCGE